MEYMTSLTICGICDSNLESPKRIKCSHSFCQSCLINFIGNAEVKDSFSCPKCAYGIKLDLNQNSVNSYVESLPDDELVNAINDVKESENKECINHLRADIDSFCKDCFEPLCVLCRHEKHKECSSFPIESDLQNSAKDVNISLLSKVQGFITEISDFHNLLLPKRRQLLTKKEETALGISDYFSELRQKVTQFLIEQERKVQEDLENLVMLEKKCLEDDVKLCTSLLHGIEEKYVNFRKFTESSNQVPDLASFKLCAAFNREIQAVQKSKSRMTPEPPETRFIINTELEDALTSSDLIKIEVMNTHQYDEEKEISTRDIRVPDAEITSNSNEEEQDTDSSPVESEPSSSESGSDSSTETEREAEATSDTTSSRNIIIEVSNPDEPPPPYPGISAISPSHTPTLRINDLNLDTHSSVETKPSLSDVLSAGSGNVRTFHHLRPVPSAPPVVESSTPYVDTEREHRPVSPQPLRREISGQMRHSQEPSPTPHRRHNHSARDRKRSNEHRPGTQLRLQSLWRASATAIGDMKSPRIYGMVWINHEYLLVTDRWNNRLKVMHTSGNVVHVFALGAFQPWDIADMYNGQSAVAVPEAKMIYIMSFVKPELAIKRKLVTKKGYSVLAYNPDDKTFVGATLSQFYSPPGIDILDKDGRLLTSCYPSNIGRTFLSYPRGITVVENRILVTDFQKKSLIFVKMEGRGHISHRYQGNEQYPFREPNGIVYNRRDHYAIVIDSRCNKLHVVSPSGRFLGMVETELEIDEPCQAALFISRDSPLLLAVAYANGNIAAYRVIDN